MFAEIKEQIIKVCLEMLGSGLVRGTSGNVSVRDEQSGLVVITPSGLPCKETSPDDLIVMDESGKIVEGFRKPTSETPMHLLVYEKRPDVNAIVHTHSPYATSFSVVNKPLKPVLSTAALIGGTVNVSPFTTPGTRELGEQALSDMGSARAVLLENHGVLAVGSNLKQAFSVATYVEDLAHIYHLALAVGDPTLVPEEYLKEFR